MKLANRSSSRDHYPGKLLSTDQAALELKSSGHFRQTLDGWSAKANDAFVRRNRLFESAQAIERDPLPDQSVNHESLESGVI